LSIFESLQQYYDTIRFHMPGHKGRELHEPYGVSKADLTELAQTDCLHRPSGMIDQAQRRIAQIYGVDKSRMLINGSSAGLLAAILSGFSPKEKVLLPRGSHLSIYHGLMLQEMEPVYIYPDVEMWAEAYTVTMEDILTAEKEHSLAGLILTYPTYLGTCADIKKIVVWAKNNNKICIVDEAHGAHLAFCEDYPVAAERVGADIVVQSTHKMLSSLTQSAMLHVAQRRVDIEKLDMYLRLFQSSSPSYLLLASLEAAVNYAEKNAKKIFEKIASARKDFAEAFADGKYFLWQPQTQYDYAKWVIGIKNTDLSGTEIQRQLSLKKIEVEYAADEFVLVYCGIGTTKDDIINLIRALNEVQPIQKKNVDKTKRTCPPAKAQMSMKEAVGQRAEYLSVREAVGRIAADFVVPYPPGIPLLVPGEMISEEIAQVILENIESKKTMIGIQNSAMKVVL
jgi:arginine/lysine/ornithine decarboxylase